MQKYIAFLRGINVGGKRIIPMPLLKSCFIDMGLSNVSTLQQSGNVVFESREDTHLQDIQLIIESTLQKYFSYPAKIVLCPMERLKYIVDGYPFDQNHNDEQHYVVFLNDELHIGLGQESFDATLETVHVGEQVVYWRVQKGMSLKSTFAKVLTKATYKEKNTVRNLNTLYRLCAASYPE